MKGKQWINPLLLNDNIMLAQKKPQYHVILLRNITVNFA